MSAYLLFVHFQVFLLRWWTLRTATGPRASPGDTAGKLELMYAPIAAPPPSPPRSPRSPRSPGPSDFDTVVTDSPRDPRIAWALDAGARRSSGGCWRAEAWFPDGSRLKSVGFGRHGHLLHLL